MNEKAVKQALENLKNFTSLIAYEEQKLSTCCGAPEVQFRPGMCSSCYEYAEFVSEGEYNGC